MPATLAIGGKLQLQGTALQFTDSSTLAVSASVLVVGGGGGAGDSGSGGSGAGEVISTSLSFALSQPFKVVVGAGGAVNSYGFASSIFYLTARPGQGVNPTNIANGALSGNGNAGGVGYDAGVPNVFYGGGGGAGGVGQNGIAGSAGGSGISSSITGSSVVYGVGGAGGRGAAGGDGASGASSSGNGGSGGAFNFDGSNGVGGTGGSGVVILKIPNTNSATFSNGVTSTTDSVSVPGYKIIKVTGTSTTSETVTFS